MALYLSGILKKMKQKKILIILHAPNKPHLYKV